MKKAWLAMLVLIGSTHVFASGFPTVDVANLSQNISGQMTRLKGLAQQIEQSGLQRSQLVTLTNEYLIALKKYKKLVKQAESLRDKVSDADWRMLARVLKRPPSISREFSSLDRVERLDTTGANYERELREVLKAQGLGRDGAFSC